MSDLTEQLLSELEELRTRDLLRKLPDIAARPSEFLTVDGRRAVNFSSNNYLGLADHPALKEASQRALREHGVGATASRLITGNLSSHRRLERHLAEWLGVSSALLFNSGYQANVGVLSALAGPNDLVCSDRLNHASIIDGVRLSRATIRVYPHLDLAALEEDLSEQRDYRRRIIVTESLFSMDGDRAPLPALLDLARAHRAILIVDEAHAIGVLGPSGSGLARDLDIDVRIGTLGKAVGVFGAYAAGSQPLTDYLANRARSFVFTTALPPSIAEAADASIAIIDSPAGQLLREALASRTARLHRGLERLGLVPPTSSPSHITPLIVGAPANALRLASALLQRGIFAQAIRPPTVPEGSARLRISLMATHTDEQIDALLAALDSLRVHFETPRVGVRR